MGSSNLSVERDGATAILTITRPRALNALDRETTQDLGAAFDELSNDDSVRAIILTGSGGKAFSAGADIGELNALENGAAGFERSAEVHAIFHAMNAMSKPIIVAVNGYALGGGCELALAGDIIIASDNAQFGLPEVGLGIIPGYGGTQRLPRLIGRVRALDMILTGRRMTASEAFECGLVSKVVPLTDLLPAATDIARAIEAKAPLAVAMAKRAVYEGLDLSLSDGSDLEARYFALAVDTMDRREGMSAFVEKRSPQWQAR